MSKIILKFDGVEESQDARDALDGYKWKGAMQELDRELRSVTKYGVSTINNNQNASAEEIEITEKLREKIRNILSGWNIQFD